jgi:hypothetical protein
MHDEAALGVELAGRVQAADEASVALDASSAALPMRVISRMFATT